MQFEITEFQIVAFWIDVTLLCVARLLKYLKRIGRPKLKVNKDAAKILKDYLKSECEILKSLTVQLDEIKRL